MDREACLAAVHGITKIQIQLSGWTEMDYSPPGSSVRGDFLQAWILEWVAMPSSRGSSQPRDWTQVSCIASLVAQRLKHLPATQETWVRSLHWEDPLEKEMATHSSIFAWRIPWMEEPGGLHTVQGGHKESDRTDFTHSLLHCRQILRFFTVWATREASQGTTDRKYKHIPHTN